jgi:hypothetical protein
MGSTLLGISTLVGVLVAKTLSNASVNPFMASAAGTYNPVLALDVFLVQAATNTLLGHFLSLLCSLWLLNVIGEGRGLNLQVRRSRGDGAHCLGVQGLNRFGPLLQVLASGCALIGCRFGPQAGCHADAANGGRRCRATAARLGAAGGDSASPVAPLPQHHCLLAVWCIGIPRGLSQPLPQPPRTPAN